VQNTVISIYVVAGDWYNGIGLHANSRGQSEVDNVAFMNLWNGHLYATGKHTNIFAVNLYQHGVENASITGGVFRHNSLITETGGWSMRSCVIDHAGTYTNPDSRGIETLIGCTQVVEPSAYVVGDPGNQLVAKVLDKNGDPTAQYYYTTVGSLMRDTVTALTPATKPASIRLNPINATNALKYEIPITILAGQSLAISANMQANAAYNGTARPLIRISGQEFNVTQAMSATNGAWELVSLTSPVATAAHTVTVSVEAIGTAGAAWFDDLTIGGKVHDAGQDLFAGGTEISTVIDITDTAKSVHL
jgi:hypothetical protein